MLVLRQTPYHALDERKEFGPEVALRLRGDKRRRGLAARDGHSSARASGRFRWRDDGKRAANKETWYNEEEMLMRRIYTA